MWIGMRSVWLRSVMYSTHTVHTKCDWLQSALFIQWPIFMIFCCAFDVCHSSGPSFCQQITNVVFYGIVFVSAIRTVENKNNWATKNAIIVRFESSLWTELVLDESFCLQPISWARRSLSRFYCIASISWIKCMRWFTIKTNRMWNILHWKRPFPLANPESCVYYVAFLLFCVDGNNFKVAITYVNGWACVWVTKAPNG